MFKKAAARVQRLAALKQILEYVELKIDRLGIIVRGKKNAGGVFKPEKERELHHALTAEFALQIASALRKILLIADPPTLVLIHSSGQLAVVDHVLGKRHHGVQAFHGTHKRLLGGSHQ